MRKLLLLWMSCVFARALEEQTCLLSNDGSCLPEDLPPIVDEYIDVGFGDRQQVTGSQETIDATMKQIREMVRYMQGTVMKDPSFEEIKNECANRNELCAYWASVGECEANPKYMKVTCAPACLTCDHLKFETRCPVDEEYLKEGIWGPGDLDKMFRRIVNEYENVTVMSSPEMRLETYAYDNPPWVVVVDDFLTDEECQALIDLGAARGYERSKDVGTRKFDGTYGSVESTGRTSSNAWCVDECYEDPIAKQVLDKLEKLTGIPDANAEYLQMLKYEESQRYESHHDYIIFHSRRAQGVRILTAFLYLNDVEDGGGTHFNTLDLTCMPKKGRVLLWASVKNDKPHEKDRRTMHEALPVLKGIKYGANAWFHQRDFKAPFANNCI
ncbi:prolyl 4-hydroxylase [Fistulifera solaris]|uniref:Prolyl 4-hydroxylase n=1 Tax=Fistulifera solaris TaxID=1519565 RepID=A0A1Z5JQ97_FISSO|nr:prolyl 4-hydroxylase [Fistulifera solaris]|eukprot:GAX16066.1 prolyl 4-hydroxylase [Fistulifera solaris]